MSRWYFAVFVSARNVMPRNCMRNVGEDADGDDERGLTRGMTRGRQHFALAVGVPGGPDEWPDEEAGEVQAAGPFRWWC